jgi:hypothetical protein
MRLGADTMEERGSGGARLAITRYRLSDELTEKLTEAATGLGDPVVVRSSSILEGGGEWSGAFTSYLDLHPSEVPVGVVGCWASAFTVHTLERYTAADIDPGSIPMAVLIQPALDPDFGGVARLSGEEVTVVAVAGSPAPLVQGWEPGAHARVSASGVVQGGEAVDLMGADRIAAVAEWLRAAHRETGANSCEWAVTGDDVHLLQLTRTEERPAVAVDMDPAFSSEDAMALARLVRRHPGPLGEELVLPWAVAAPELAMDDIAPADVEPATALEEAITESQRLIAEVWNAPKAQSIDQAGAALRDLRSGDPTGAVARFRGLRRPDPERAREVLALLSRVRHALVEAGAVSRPELGWHVTSRDARTALRSGAASELRVRIGFDRWEPFEASVVVAGGHSTEGVPAAPGIAAGRMYFVSDPYDTAGFRPRDVVVGTHPIPNLAALLWDASALVTLGGGPGAHLFESARALAIPAVCGIHLDEILGGTPADRSGEFTLAVDGHSGQVWATPW